MRKIPLVLSALIIPFLIPDASAQVINVNATTPCFFNYTAGIQMWENCGIGDDYLTFSLLGWEWITGGNFSMVLVSVFILGTYLKYHKMMYPILIGVTFLPISWFLFPQSFFSWAVIMAFLGIGIGLWYILVRQTKEYS